MAVSSPYLDFKDAKCKDCFKCLRECPVKAIRYENHQAKIIEQKCILCGHCTLVCPQNAKQVHSEADDVLKLLAGKDKVIASVAPSFVSSFGLQDFGIMQIALGKLGFAYAEETSVGAKVVTEEYAKLLATGEYRNFITSACPAVNHMIQLYYPKALKYLAPVASPMVAHARMLKKKFPDCKIVFIGPCIAKKREGKESGIIDAVLTFDELNRIFEQKNIDLGQIASFGDGKNTKANRAKFYPISRGIIKSFEAMPAGYEYVAVDGVKRCFEVLEDIDEFDGLFLELNCCEHACVGGPCRIEKKGGSLKANEEVRKYASREAAQSVEADADGVILTELHPRIKTEDRIPSERDIRAILAKTGKNSPEDELNCGACGYSTCRDKAIAVLNGYADIEMCLPYMRSRAESMSYEILQNSPNGIVLLDNDFRILDINTKAIKILGITEHDVKGANAFDCFECDDFIAALAKDTNVSKKKVFVNRTKKYMELSIVLLREHKVMFGVMKDITDSVEYDEKLNAIKMETLATTDEVIKKQMRVAQEIASLLGETTAETKVALLKLKETLQPRSSEEDDD